MKITWLGHSSFLIEDSDGRKILTDPFDESVGYEVFKGNTDIVTISHQHFDHNYIKNLPPNTKVIDKAGFFNIGDIPIEGFPSFHDKEEGAKRGENIIFVFEVDGYRVCHLGDLGYVLSKDEISKLGSIDVLLIPIGGNFTIDGAEAALLSKEIKSHIVIPMHYKTGSLNFTLEGLEKFLINMKNAYKTDACTLNMNGDLNEYNQVKILEYKKGTKA
ncbi:MAG: MBL fold metallo-hydrolase [Solirubrobacterales bacterium]